MIFIIYEDHVFSLDFIFLFYAQNTKEQLLEAR